MDATWIARHLLPPGNRAAIGAHEDLQRLISTQFASVDTDGWVLVNPSVHRRPKMPYVHALRLAGLGNGWALLRTDGAGSVGCVLHRLPNHPWMWRTDGRVWLLPKGRMPIDTARALTAHALDAGPVFPLWTLPTIDPARAMERVAAVCSGALQGFYALHGLTGVVQASLPRVVRTYAGPTWSGRGTKLPTPMAAQVGADERALLGAVLAHLLRQAGMPMESFASMGCGGTSDRPVLVAPPKVYINADSPPSAHARLPWIQRWRNACAEVDGACAGA